MRRNKRALIYLITILFVMPILGQVPFKKIKINKTIQMEIPEEFLPMSEVQIQQKYVSNQPPIAMFTSRDEQVDFGINVTSTAWGSDLPLIRQFYKAGISSLYDDVLFIQDTISEINGRSFIVFEFVGTVLGEENAFQTQSNLKRYIYIMYTPYDEKIMLFNFNAPGRLRNQWQKAAQRTMQSITIR